MTIRINTSENAVWYKDEKGFLGGSFREPESDPDGTAMGPIYAPDGGAWSLFVDDLGAVKTITFNK